MSTLLDLEQRIQTLEDVEAIKKLKAKYWFCVDNKQWDSLADCYAENVVFESPQFGRMEGRNYIIKVLKRAMKSVKTAHQGHNPDIEIGSETSATGRWMLNDQVGTSENGYFKGYGYYDDEYVKVDGKWKIQKTKLAYIFEESTLELAKADNRETH